MPSFTGVALPPETTPNHWSLLGLDIDSHHLDIRDKEALGRLIDSVQPELVLHLAAQPLVRRSYREPVDTWTTNVIGTANLLDACRHVPSVRGILVVTSDKCYENREWVWGYREDDRLGGHDPYSASKAATELLVGSYRASFFQGPDAPVLASGRAGNVIGGGDWSEDRLIPDIVRAVANGSDVAIPLAERHAPLATRAGVSQRIPVAGAAAAVGASVGVAEAWNFGPAEEGNRSVQSMMEGMATLWPAMHWHIEEDSAVHEARLLYLDSAKSRAELQWNPVWGFDEALSATVDWYRDYLEKGTVLSALQLERYVRAAANKGLVWCRP